MTDDQPTAPSTTPVVAARPISLRSGRAWRRLVFFRETPKRWVMALCTLLVASLIANFFIGETQFERLYFGILGFSALPMWAAMVYQRVYDRRRT